MWLEIGLGVVAVGVFLFALQQGHISFSSKRTIDYVSLQWLLDEEKAKRFTLLEELTEAYRRIQKLENSEISLRLRIEELEKTTLNTPPRREDLPLTPLLLICGDKKFCTDDAVQFSRAKIWYRILEGATKSLIEDEFARRRQNGDLYPWVHISAHGGSQGIQLADGIAEPGWWARTLEGVRVLVAANCDSIVVGDALAGVCDCVIVFYGERESSQIERFIYVFWETLMQGLTASEAYRVALIQNPQVRPYVDFRKS